MVVQENQGTAHKAVPNSETRRECLPSVHITCPALVTRLHCLTPFLARLTPDPNGNENLYCFPQPCVKMETSNLTAGEPHVMTPLTNDVLAIRSSARL